MESSCVVKHLDEVEKSLDKDLIKNVTKLGCAFGDLAEWFKATALKAVDGKPSVSSNLTVSARSRSLA